MSSRDIDIALQHARCAIEDAQDHFIRDKIRPAGGLASTLSTPYPMTQPRYDEPRRYGNQFQADHTEELVRRTNLAVSLANHNINPRSQFTLVHPMMCWDGSFPSDFRTPRTMEAVKLLDSMEFQPLIFQFLKRGTNWD